MYTLHSQPKTCIKEIHFDLNNLHIISFLQKWKLCVWFSSFNNPSKSVRSFEGNGINTYHWVSHRIPQGEKSGKKHVNKCPKKYVEGLRTNLGVVFKKSRHHP